jgi:quercetin dioxygenase-like cupin family protein
LAKLTWETAAKSLESATALRLRLYFLLSLILWRLLIRVDESSSVTDFRQMNRARPNISPGCLRVRFVFIESKTTSVEQIDSGVTRQMLGYDSQLMMVSVRFEKGAAGSLHFHPHRQVSYVVSGKFEVQIGEQKKTLTSGDSYFVEPDVIHGVLALEAGTLVDAFAPCRKDFLKP